MLHSFQGPEVRMTIPTIRPDVNPTSIGLANIGAQNLEAEPASEEQVVLRSNLRNMIVESNDADHTNGETTQTVSLENVIECSYV